MSIPPRPWRPLRLAAFIRRGGGRCTCRDLVRAGPCYPTAAAARDALDWLAAYGYGAWAHARPGPRGGQPRRVFVLGPPLGPAREAAVGRHDAVARAVVAVAVPDRLRHHLSVFACDLLDAEPGLTPAALADVLTVFAAGLRPGPGGGRRSTAAGNAGPGD